MKKRPSFILGLTGSIAMGKTTVSQMFEELNVPVWCADTEVKKLYEKRGEATKKIAKLYPEVVSEKGIDKNKLRNIIHVDNSILGVIEEIVHPLLIGSREAFLKLNQKAPIVIFDIPLLLEKKLEKTGKKNIILDPGIGFGKTLKHNLSLISKISLFHTLGFPILIGTSRKRFINQIAGTNDSKERIGGTVASVLYLVSQGVQIFRIHDVNEINQSIKVFRKILFK